MTYFALGLVILQADQFAKEIGHPKCRDKYPNRRKAAHPLQQAPASPRLHDLVRGVLRREHYSMRTEQSSVDWIKRFILFHRKQHPAQMGKAEVTSYLTHLAV